MKTEANDPINPTFGYDQLHLNVEVKDNGLTKREYFAAMAMQGLLANPNPGSVEKCAVMAAEAATYLINVLNKQKDEEL